MLANSLQCQFFNINCCHFYQRKPTLSPHLIRHQQVDLKYSLVHRYPSKVSYPDPRFDSEGYADGWKLVPTTIPLELRKQSKDLKGMHIGKIVSKSMSSLPNKKHHIDEQPQQHQEEERIQKNNSGGRNAVNMSDLGSHHSATLEQSTNLKGSWGQKIALFCWEAKAGSLQRKSLWSIALPHV